MYALIPCPVCNGRRAVHSTPVGRLLGTVVDCPLCDDPTQLQYQVETLTCDR